MQISHAFKKYLTEKNDESDFIGQMQDSKFLLSVLYRFILDRYEAEHVEQLKLADADGHATHKLFQSIGQQRVLRKLAKEFSNFGLDDHPLIKDAKSVLKETIND